MRAERRSASERCVAAGAACLLAVALSACSDTSASTPAPGASSSPVTTSPTPTPSPSTSAPLDLRTEAGEVEALQKVDGYRLGEPSKQVLEAVARAAQQYEQVSTGRVVRSVKKGDRAVGHLVVFGLDNGFTGSEAFRGQIVQALTLDLAGPDAEPSAARIDRKTVTAAASDDDFAVGWLDDASLVVLVAPVSARDSVLQYAAEYRTSR